MTATLPANNTRRQELSSQRTQIIRHVAKLSQHSGVVKVADSWIASATERDRACMAQDFPKTLRTLYRGCRGWTFYWFTDNDAAVSNVERQCHEICNPGHGSPSQSYQSLRSAGTASNFPRA